MLELKRGSAAQLEKAEKRIMDKMHNLAVTTKKIKHEPIAIDDFTDKIQAVSHQLPQDVQRKILQLINPYLSNISP